MRVTYGPGVILALVATLLFALAALDVNVGNLSESDLMQWGLAAFAAAHVIR